MPSTRPQVAREQKESEIISAAHRQLDEMGYEALSVASLARELGVSQNTIYWYFPSKDHLLVAVLRRMAADIAARKPRGKDTLSRVLWFSDELAGLAAYRPALLERAAKSEVIAEFVADLDGTLERMLTNAFRGQVPDDELAMTATMFRALVEGTYAQRLGVRRRRAVLGFAYERLTSSE